MSAAAAPWVDDVDTLVANVADEALVAVGGFHFTRVPVAQLRALNRRRPQRLHYIAWGGGLALELLLAAGAVARATLTFSSLDLFGLAPRFRRAVENAEIELEEMTALAMIKGLEAAGEHMAYEVFQTACGSLFADRFRPAPILEADRLPLSIAPALEPDVLLLHAQRADEDGNVELGGARGLDLSCIFAARSVLVTVEERVAAGELGRRGSFIVPRAFVGGVALAPGGAYPTSCLPNYVADYGHLQQVAEANPEEPFADSLFDAAGIGDVEAIARQPPHVLRTRLRATARDDADERWTVDELMAVWIARQLDDSSVCSIGSASPLPTAGYLLAKRLWAPRLTLLSFNGGFVDVPLRPLSLLAAEVLDYEGAVAHAGGDETYHWYYQSGLVTHEIVSAAQIDQRAATNNLRITRSDGSHVRLPGQGGMADVANLHANFVLYLARHSRRTLVDTVELVSARREFNDGAVRERLGLQPGVVRLITNLAVFELAPEHERLTLTQLHPGVTLEAVREQTGFDLTVADELQETEPPTASELSVLRQEIDPLGIRRLDFVPAAERGTLIRELLAAERNALLEDVKAAA